MKIKKLIESLPITLYRGSKDLEIKGLCSHSKYVAPGDLFIAKRGSCDDGAHYLDEALAAGARAFLTDLPDPSRRSVAQLIASDVAGVEGALAHRFYGKPSEALFAVGVTGTNGKTTVTHLVRHLFERLGVSTGLIGTIEYVIGGYHFDAELTTPDVLTNHRLLGEMVKQRCEAVAMEVSSHALAQNRVECIAFDVAVFTNLSRDHLDYHGTWEAYVAAKERLFRELAAASTAVVELGGVQITYRSPAHVLTYGLSPEADLYADHIVTTLEKTTFRVHFAGKSADVELPLIGSFNVLNALAAVGTALVRGYRLDEIAPCFSSFPPIRGRLERVAHNIYVDFAHTPHALQCVLKALRLTHQGRIIVVFGAGGERDRVKREEMGVVASLADLAILTSDNPRKEDPHVICEEIAAGCQGDYLIEIDRRCAIERALSLAHPQDLVLIAGKGHETTQTFAHKTLPFDDRQVVHELLDEVKCS